MSFSGNQLSDNTGVTITNDGFFPDIELDVFLRDYRLPGDYAADMVQSQVALSMCDINTNLEVWRLDQEADSYSTLADIPTSEVNGESRLILLYRRAVFCRAKAELLMQFATVTRKDQGENTAIEAVETEDKFLEYSVQAVRRIMGLHSIGVDLL